MISWHEKELFKDSMTECSGLLTPSLWSQEIINSRSAQHNDEINVISIHVSNNAESCNNLKWLIYYINTKKMNNKHIQQIS